jgi:hypothetical protein
VDIQSGDLQKEPFNYHVFSIEDGEWLQYTVAVVDAGRYTISITISAADTGGMFSLLCNDKPLADNISINNTGGLANWRTIAIKKIDLQKGWNQLRIVANKGGFNFSQMRFVKER